MTAMLAAIVSCSSMDLYAGSILDWQPDDFDQIEGLASTDQTCAPECVVGVAVGAGEASARSDHSGTPINPLTGWPFAFGIYGSVVVQTTLDSGSAKKTTGSEASESGLICADSIHDSLRLLAWLACNARTIPPRGIPIELLRPPNLQIAIAV